ncbi:hypothetical protein quinque_014371 [Culex quinquefasciatus]
MKKIFPLFLFLFCFPLLILLSLFIFLQVSGKDTIWKIFPVSIEEYHQHHVAPRTCPSAPRRRHRRRWPP